MEIDNNRIEKIIRFNQLRGEDGIDEEET